MTTPAPSTERLAQTLERVLETSAALEWRGHDKHDGLNSPILWAACGWNRPMRLLSLQAVMRSPINLRGVLAVPRVHNPKGLALFIQSFVNRWRIQGHERDLAGANHLLDLLDHLRSPPGLWSGRAWGYQYPWQDLGFFAPRGMPNAVVTCFVCEALLDLHAATRNPVPWQMVKDALPFLLKDLPVLHQNADQLCLGYMPIEMKMRVMDVSMLIGALLARIDAVHGTTDNADTAQRLVGYVLGQQTIEGAWWYTDPPEASPVRIDNYHTGFILDALWRYMHTSKNFDAMDRYQLGLNFYADRLFEDDGAPRWMSDQRYPNDVHGSAQGILTFCRHADQLPGLADRVANWALAHLYNGNGSFWYRRGRWHTHRTLFLRWNNGWMARALSDLLLYRHGMSLTAASVPPPTSSRPHNA